MKGLFDIIRPENIVTPNNSVEVLLNTAQYAIQKKLFKSVNDKAVVNKSIKMTNEFIALETYIRHYYNHLIKEVIEIGDDDKIEPHTKIVTEDEIEVLTTLDLSKYNPQNASIDIIKIKEHKINESYYAMLNSHSYVITPDMLVIRINLSDGVKIHIPFDVKQMIVDLI